MSAPICIARARGTLIELPLAWYSGKRRHWAMSPGYDRDYMLPPARHRLRMHVLPQRLSREFPPGHDEPGSEPLYSGALARRHRLPALPRTWCEIMSRSPQTAGSTSRTCAQSDRESGSPHPRTPDGGVHAMPSRNHQPAAAAFHHTLRPRTVFLPSRRATRAISPSSSTTPRAANTRTISKSPIPPIGCANRNAFLTSGKVDVHHLPQSARHSPRRGRRSRPLQRRLRPVPYAAFRQSVDAGKHTAESDCITCHMPKRRTQDVDSRRDDGPFDPAPPARRRSAGPIAERQEFDDHQYRGEVVPYYPSPLPPDRGERAISCGRSGDTEKQSRQGPAAIGRGDRSADPAAPEFYVELGQAWLERRQARQCDCAFEEAARREPDSPVAA